MLWELGLCSGTSAGCTSDGDCTTDGGWCYQFNIPLIPWVWELNMANCCVTKMVAGAFCRPIYGGNQARNSCS
jgi:hypothetical protein